MPDDPKDYKEVTEVSTEPWVPLPPEEWTEPERWVWERVRTGRVADFNERYHKQLDPKGDALWVGKEKEKRALRPEFLRTILLIDPWCGLISHVGVCIFGACFESLLDLSAIEVLCRLWVDKSRLEGGLICMGSSFNYNVSLEGSVVGVKFVLSGSEFKSSLNLSECIINNTRLLRVRVGETIIMEKTESRGRLSIDGAKIDGDLYLTNGRFNDVCLPGISVNGQLSMTGSRFNGEVEIFNGEIKQDVFSQFAVFRGSLSIHYSSIGGSLYLRGAVLQRLLLPGSTVRAIVDGQMMWPDQLLLEGCSYENIRKLDEYLNEIHMSDRPSSWFVSWLARQKEYSPQPYQQCAKVLREAGQPGKANEVLYAGKEREREEALDKKEMRRFRWLTFLKYAVGYGLTWRFFWWPAGWAALLWVIGLIFCLATPEAYKHSFFWSMGYSLNRLVPLVDLHPTFKTASSLNFFPAAWFMFQTLCGWFLATLIIAGLAGVGKPGGRES